MNLFPLLVMIVVFLADGGLGPSDARPGAVVCALAAPAIMISVMALLVRRARRAIAQRRGVAAVLRTERVLRLFTWLLIINHVIATLTFGWLIAVRSVTGDLILVDELLAIAPPIVGLAGLWWVYYPIERRLQEAMLISRLDRGQPVFTTPGRWRYIMQQMQMHVLLLLVPLLLIVGLAETAHTVATVLADAETARTVEQIATPMSALLVFLAAPLLMVYLLNVQPLREGPVHEALMDICKRHRVRIRGLYVWHTGGLMINAAVLGLFGRVRCVLVTDGLLNSLRTEALAAVLAHEIGHVRRHHLPWLVVLLLACLTAALLAIEGPLVAADVVGLVPGSDLPSAMQHIMIGGELILALLLFGWVSRRFERQADTFAAQHLSGLGQPDERVRLITPHAVLAMNDALQSIAELNHVDPHRPSWRHGSIAWRQQYLLSIIGSPVRALPIDRIVRRLKVTAVVIVLGTAAVDALLIQWPPPPTEVAALTCTPGTAVAGSSAR